MKRTKRALLAALCALLLCLPLGAFGQARLPAERGVVTDDADALSARIAEDIAAYAEKLDDKADIKLHVVIVHFLDGLDAQTYANRLFDEWGLGGDDMLLLGAAGEDTAATALGEDLRESLGESNARNLMYTSSRFSELFAAQRYDEAFDAYFTALNALVQKRTGEAPDIKGLFQNEQSAANKTSEASGGRGSQLWDEVMEAIQNKSSEYETAQASRQSERSSMGPGGWIVLGIIALLVFRKKRRKRA